MGDRATVTADPAHADPATTDLAAGLVQVLEPLDGGGPIGDLVRLTGGASRQTWSFTARLAGERTRLVLQREQPGEDRSRSLEREAVTLRAAAAAGVPVAPVVTADDSGGPLGSPYLLVRHVAGETVGKRVLSDPGLAAGRAGLAAQCGRALGHIHGLGPEAVPGLAARDELAWHRAELDAVEEPHPVFELALRFLEQNPQPAVPPRPVHGDFRLGNLIVGPDGLRAVLDWEHQHLGDPVEDLGYLCVRSWRFGGDLPVGGFGEAHELLDGYAEVTGTRPSTEALRWWQIVGTLRWGIACVAQYRRHASGGVRSHELALIGRRACECEHDLLRLLP